MAKGDEAVVEQDVANEVATFGDPVEPEGSGRVTLVTRYPYGVYNAKNGAQVKATGTNLSRADADEILKEAPSKVRELKKEG